MKQINTVKTSQRLYRVALRDGSNAIGPLTEDQRIAYTGNLYSWGILAAFIVIDYDTDEVVLDFAERLQDESR